MDSTTAGDVREDDDGGACNASREKKGTHPKWRYMMILLAAFMINFTACGVLFGFGVYQALYETMALEDGTPFTGASSGDIDLIGSLSISLMTIGAPLAVAWSKHFRPQLVVSAGGLAFGLGAILASFGTALWHFQLAQGLLMGIGTCFSYMPSMTVTPTWFSEHRGLAMGIVSAGTGIGGLVWAPAITACIGRIGFRNTLRLTGTISTALICASGAALGWEPSVAARVRNEASGSSGIGRFLQIPYPSWKTATQRKFVAQALCAAFQSAAYYTPVFFTVAYAETLGYTETDGANFTAISNACNAIGKVGIGYAADKLGRLNCFFLTTLLTTATIAGLWIPSTLVGGYDEGVGRSLFISFTVLYGIFASAFISLFPAVLVELFGLKGLPRVAGVMYMMQGMAALVGTPVAGVLVRDKGAAQGPQGYLPMSILVDAFMLGASLTTAWVRIESGLEHITADEGWRWKL